MKIPVQIRTISGAILKRTVTAVTPQKAESLGLKPITEPQRATSIDGATFIANTFLGMVRSGIKCAIVHTNAGQRLTVYRAGVVLCEQLTRRMEKTECHHRANSCA